MTRKTPNECGRDLEDYVARLYAGLGYHVQTDVQINGQQVDMLAVKQERGAGAIKLLIECKYLSSGSVANQVVHEFRHFIESAKRDAAITKGIIVSNASFARTARLAAGHHVELLSTRDLENRCYVFHESLSAFVDEYKHQGIFGRFVPLSGHAAEPIANLTSWALKLVVSEHSALRLVSMLADYGSGKTTLLRRLQYELSQLALMQEEAKKPVFFELKHFHRFGDVELFAQYCLRKQFGIDFPMAVFRAGLEAGKFVLLLDGFDEMSSHADRRRKLDDLRALAPLIGGNCISFITCRQAYFVSEAEYLETFDRFNTEMAPQNIARHRSNRSLREREELQGAYERLYAKYVAARPLPTYLSHRGEQLTVYLDAFSKEQIALYLSRFESQFKKRCELTAAEVLQRLGEIYDLTGLMSTPILLSMIIDTILDKGREFLSQADKLGPAGLYSMYTSLKLDIDWKKGQTRRLLTKEQRRSFAEALALTLYDEDRLEVSYSQATAIIDSSLGSIRKPTGSGSMLIEHVVNDVLTCTFITRGNDDLLRFIHKSYMEFFVAARMRASLLQERPDPRIREKILPREVLYFLGSFVAQDPEVRAVVLERVLEIMEADDASQARRRNITQEGAYRANIVGAYLCGCPQLNGMKLKRGPVVNIDISQSHFHECEFIEMSFAEVRWAKSRLTKVLFKHAGLYQTQLVACQLTQVRGDLSFDGSRMEACEIVDSALHLKGPDGGIEGGRLISSSLELSGSMRLAGVTMSNTQVSFLTGTSAPIVIEKSSFDTCTFVGSAARSIDSTRLEPDAVLTHCALAQCTVVALVVPMEFVLREAMRAPETQLRGLLIIDDGKIDSKHDVERRNLLARLDADGHLACNPGLFAVRGSFVQAQGQSVIDHWLERLKLQHFRTHPG